MLSSIGERIGCYTYLLIERFRKPNGMVTCGDSATYPMAGGVQQGPWGREGVGIVRLFPWRGARSFWTAEDEEEEEVKSSAKHVFHYY